MSKTLAKNLTFSLPSMFKRNTTADNKPKQLEITV